MTAETSISPLSQLAEQLERASNDRVRIREVPFLTQLSVRVPPDSAASSAVGAALGVPLPQRSNTLARGRDLRVLWLGPDEWLVVANPGEQDRLDKAIRTAIGDDFGSVLDVSAQRTTLSVQGPDTLDLLAGGCALDLDPEVFTENRCAQTMLARAQVVLNRQDGGFAVAVRASFADYLARWLLDAMIEYPTT